MISLREFLPTCHKCPFGLTQLFDTVTALVFIDNINIHLGPPEGPIHLVLNRFPLTMKCSIMFQLVVDFVRPLADFFTETGCDSKVSSDGEHVGCLHTSKFGVHCALTSHKIKSVCVCDATSEQTTVGRTNSYMCVCLCVLQSWGTLQIWVLISWATAARATEGWEKPSLIFVFWGWIMYLAVEKASRWLPNVCLLHSLQSMLQTANEREYIGLKDTASLLSALKVLMPLLIRAQWCRVFLSH